MQYTAAVGLEEWDSVECERCNVTFEISTAIDKMLSDPADWDFGYLLFGGLRSIFQRFKCEWGTTELMDVRDAFDRVYHVTMAMSGTVLSGGLSVRYLPTGHVMLAVAPSPDGSQGSVVDITIAVIGMPEGEAPMPAWRELFVEGRKYANRSRRLPPILSVAAVDAFLADRLGREPRFNNRPQDWNDAAEEISGRRLFDLLGRKRYSGRLTTAIKVRNECAHDGDPKHPMSADLAKRESRWERQHQRIHHDLQLAPSGKLVLEECLAAVRAVRREDRLDTRTVGPSGVVEADCQPF